MLICSQDFKALNEGLEEAWVKSDINVSSRSKEEMSVFSVFEVVDKALSW